MFPPSRRGRRVTPHLFEEGFFTASGLAAFTAPPASLRAEEPDDEYPLAITPARIGPSARRTGTMASAQLHPKTARRYGLASGSAVLLATRRSSARFVVQVSMHVLEDAVFIPWREEASRFLAVQEAPSPTNGWAELKMGAARIEAPRRAHVAGLRWTFPPPPARGGGHLSQVSDLLLRQAAPQAI